MIPPVITGSFIDIMHPCTGDGVYWNRRTVLFNGEDWLRLVRHLHRDIGIDTLFLQNAVWEGRALYPSRHIERRFPTAIPDPVGAIVDATSVEGMNFYLGSGWAYEDRLIDCFGPMTEEALGWYAAVHGELLERYGDKPSFSGFYLSSEMYLGNRLKSEQVDFTRHRVDELHRMAPGMPVAAVAGVLGEVADVDGLVVDIEKSGLDRILYTVDPVAWFTNVSDPYETSRWEPRFAALRKAHEHAGVPFWAHIETFIFEHDIRICGRPLHPAPFSRLRRQLELASRYADKITCYTAPGLMTSQESFPGLGVPETERLYREYRTYRERASGSQNDGAS